MNYNNSSAKLLAVALLVLVQWVSVSVSDWGCKEKERSALLQINAALPFPIHSSHGNWELGNKECCRWERITCDQTTGHVTQLDLSTDDWSYDSLGFSLNVTMFLPLSQLRSLSLSGQAISDCAGLETWFKLTKLENLDLSYNQLDGSIIYDLSSVPSLRTLKLIDSNINGDLVINGLETWSKLTKLESLDLSNNRLDGRIISKLANVRSLRTLKLIYNNINSSMAINELQTWSNLTKLEILDLSANQLDGSIIYDLANVRSLRTLILSYNTINSSMAIKGFESWSNLTKLETLDLSGNQLPKSIISSLANVSSLRELYLDYNTMGGNVPVIELSALNLEVVSLSNCMFSGSIPYLGHWSSLKALSLAANDLSGILTSKGLCRLKNLEELDLSGNKFTGNLLPCMGNLSSLRLVDLSNNQFQVQFPSSIFERLTSLRYLSLSNNQLEGTMTMRSFLNHSNLEVLGLSTSTLNFRVEVVNLSFQLEELELANCIIDVEPTYLCSQHKLQFLDLSNTHSKGSVPIVWLLENNTNLIQLDLHKNFFTGPLQLPLLIHENLLLLDISNNHLGGELPPDITTKLPYLCFLNLSKNYFEGPLPFIRNIPSLDLSSNNLIDDIRNNFSGFLPLFFSFMDLSNNKLYGSFTNNFNFTQNSTLRLNDNNISGEIPSSICNTNFIVLDISNNQLNGVIPDCIGRAEISVLKLSGNHLEGPLPLEMCAIQGLWLLDLSHNKLSGSIPPCSNQSTLEIVNLSQNKLIGNFPITWLNISDLYSIDIGENHLSGELSIWTGKESGLRMLQARENLFEGPIPEQICQFKYLRILDLSHNNLSGQIQSCITDMGSASRDFTSFHDALSVYGTLDLNGANFFLHVGNDISSIKKPTNFGLLLMSKGRLDFYEKNTLLIDSIIDLSSNILVGSIPKDIGQMNWLITLSLSNNHLSGAIPNSISNLHRLESLDLSHNSLTGEIPRELTKLTSLESFSVAYNDLSGPTLGLEAQFSTFGISSFEGNPNLCGPPLSKSCVPTLNTTQPSPDEMSDDRRHEDTNFLILFGSFSLSFVVSFWGFIVVLYIKRNWCYVLFTLVDWYGDMIYVKVVLLRRKIGAALTRSRT